MIVDAAFLLYIELVILLVERRRRWQLTNCSDRGTLSSLSLCTLAVAEPSSAAAASIERVLMVNTPTGSPRQGH